MPRTELVPDDVWAHLDPAEGRLSRSSRRALALGGLTLVVVVVIVILGQISGVLGSPLDETSSGGGYTRGSRVLNEEVQLRDGGWFDQHIDAVEVTAPFATLTRSTISTDTVATGATTRIRVTVRITDCSAVDRHTEVPVAVELHRWWGTHTQSVAGSDTVGWAWKVCH